MNKFKYIQEVADLLKDQLPTIVTKEELINHYLHKMKVKRSHEMSITVNRLILAAHIAGKQIKGNSKLQTMSFKEQLKYINKEYFNPLSENTKGLKGNKEVVINSYLEGEKVKDIAAKFGCSGNAVRIFLRKNGVVLSRTVEKRERVEVGMGLY